MTVAIIGQDTSELTILESKMRQAQPSFLSEDGATDSRDDAATSLQSHACLNGWCQESVWGYVGKARDLRVSQRAGLFWLTGNGRYDTQ